ncbi:MAG: energy transducer TonB [Saprospiraceae bacterium]
MQREKKDTHFVKKPYYVGGLSAMRQFISSHLQYPPEALQGRIEGTVHVRYTLDRTGAVIGARVIAGIGNGCDEEALRVVRLLKFHAPKNQVQNIKFHKTIQIHFRLPAQNPQDQQPESVSYVYAITPKTQPEVEKSPTSGVITYSYTISGT